MLGAAGAAAAVDTSGAAAAGAAASVAGGSGGGDGEGAGASATGASPPAGGRTAGATADAGQRKLSARGCKENLEAFATGGIDYVDNIMLDYPGPDADSIRGQWAALEEMKKQGTTRALSVSNFSPAQLDAVLVHQLLERFRVARGDP